MRQYPDALAAHFAREVTTVCHCWRLTRKDGEVTGYTDHDRPLAVAGAVFEPQSGFAASEARGSLGLSVDTVDIEGALSSERIRDEDIAAGAYDGATVEILMVNWREPADFVVLKKATVGKITRSDGHFVAELESLVHSLDQPNGRYVTRNCDAELGDKRCGFLLDQPGFTGIGEVEAYEAPDRLRVTALDGFEAGWFFLGALTWQDGPRIGRTERIVDHRLEAGATVLILQPAIGPTIGAGDRFTISAGCDKTFATCQAKFSNALNFRGFPHLPGNDSAYAYVTDGGNFDGGPIVP